MLDFHLYQKLEAHGYFSFQFYTQLFCCLIVKIHMNYMGVCRCNLATTVKQFKGPLQGAVRAICVNIYYENIKDPFQHVKQVKQAWKKKNIGVNHDSKGLHMNDPLCAQICGPWSFQLSCATSCHFFTTMMASLLMRPMEVIKRILFMPEHVKSASYALPLLWLIRDSSADGWRWLRYTGFTVGSPVL